ncbi:hypothetical protein T01_10679 [Trichinella spiralis]|uniref:Uncharacterized protein n=1 Tax=Trichinella spiralis TaxID=6334 RepID=A0A0V1BUQ2_TRISP|nr:hypothetical protein T01_10679 [Trichinella spiralis]
MGDPETGIQNRRHSFTMRRRWHETKCSGANRCRNTCSINPEIAAHRTIGGGDVNDLHSKAAVFHRSSSPAESIEIRLINYP